MRGGVRIKRERESIPNWPLKTPLSNVVMVVPHAESH